MTAQIRSLQSDIRSALDTPNAQDWSEDVGALGIAFPEDADGRDKLCKALAAAFGAVASEVSKDGKRGASVRYLADTGEVAVTFRVVKPRAK
jgi:hypothetical protein